MKNKIETKEHKLIFAGSFPIETKAVESKTKLEAGDIIGLDSSNNFGKYDGSTYTTIYGVAYDEIDEAGEITAILTGGLVKDFVKFKNETVDTIELRKLGIFIK